jgi:hypothetical protein
VSETQPAVKTSRVPFPAVSSDLWSCGTFNARHLTAAALLRSFSK